MPGSLLYHALGLKGVNDIRRAYEKGSTIMEAEVTAGIENYPLSGSCRTIRRKS